MDWLQRKLMKPPIWKLLHLCYGILHAQVQNWLAFLIEQYSINAITQVMPILLCTHRTLFILRVDIHLSPKAKDVPVLYLLKKEGKVLTYCVSQLLPA